MNKHAQQLGKIGGLHSTQSRFRGKTKDEISTIMRNLRYSKIQIKKLQKMGDELVQNLNRNIKKRVV